MRAKHRYDIIMIINLFRILIGYKWDWKEYQRVEFSDGLEILFICQKTGRMKKVWMGA